MYNYNIYICFKCFIIKLFTYFLNDRFLSYFFSLGLRLMMGEFPVERALDHLIKESTHGWRRLNCDRLFPRYIIIINKKY